MASPHGYSRYARGCRCDVCRVDHARYNREWERAQPKRPPSPRASGRNAVSCRIFFTAPCRNCGSIRVARDQYDARTRKFCSKPCAYQGRKLRGTFAPGHPDLVPPDRRGHSPETRQKISAFQRAHPRRGPDSATWKGGGRRTERKEAMGRWEYKQWRDAVFVRDDYTCRDCGARGLYMHADHVVPWAEDEALRFEPSNGRTLCYRCHFLKTFGWFDEDRALRWGVPAGYRGRP